MELSRDIIKLSSMHLVQSRQRKKKTYESIQENEIFNFFPDFLLFLPGKILHITNLLHGMSRVISTDSISSKKKRWNFFSELTFRKNNPKCSFFSSVTTFGGDDTIQSSLWPFLFSFRCDLGNKKKKLKSEKKYANFRCKRIFLWNALQRTQRLVAWARHFEKIKLRD